MADPRVLYVVHNHPAVRPGGAEAYALELYRGMKELGDFDPLLLARSGPPLSKIKQPHPGTVFAAAGSDPGQSFVYTDLTQIDWLFGGYPDKSLYNCHLREFLQAHQPSVVHFQHVYLLGYETIRLTRRVLPRAPILFTLHEFLPICHHYGHLLRTGNRELCLEASPVRCHQCFPDISPRQFFLRKQYIQKHFDEVDLFLAPSRFLIERFVDWGLPRHKIRFEEYGRRDLGASGAETPNRPRNRFAFFGQLTPFKGADVLLRAMVELAEMQQAGGGDAETDAVRDLRLWLYGANMDLQPLPFRAELQTLLERCGDRVTYVDGYRPEDLAALMQEVDWVVVPSIWWENSPLVIQEAFAFGRPVICSDVGGMAEKVSHERSGLHFRVGSASSLAATMVRAATTPGLWEELRQGIPPLYRLETSVRVLGDIYKRLIADRAAASAAV
ncbi:MAG TPA: glycosyltransferase family 4 protein [Thermoanaerobaculia bacterium]|nr:glycosyltransferase family 4 protein [Thermoanaerobaculia bacterium]